LLVQRAELRDRSTTPWITDRTCEGR